MRFLLKRKRNLINDSIASSLQGMKRSERYYKTFTLKEVYKDHTQRKRVTLIKNGYRKMIAKYRS